MSTFVPPKIAIEGAELISSGVKNSLPGNVVKGVELMLLNSCIDSSIILKGGQSDVTVLLRQGLDYLSKSPYEALGVPVGSKTVQIRKAFKKSALKYHPDKNPKTTPLFQVMNAACDRLCDPLLREKEERAAFAKQPSQPSSAGVPPQTTQAPTAPTGHGSGAGAFPFQSNPSMKPTQAPPFSSYGANAAKPPAQDTATAAPPFQFPPFARPRYDPRTNKWNVDTDWTKYAQPSGANATPIGANANSNPDGNNINMQYPRQQQPSEQQQAYRAQEATKRRQYYEEVLKEQINKADQQERKEKDDAALKQQQQQRAKFQEDKYGAKSNKSNITAAAAAGPEKPSAVPVPNAGKPDDKPTSQSHYFGGNGPGLGGAEQRAKHGPTPPSGSNSNEPVSPKSSSFFNAGGGGGGGGLGSRSGSFKGMGGMKPAPVPAPSPAPSKVPRPYGLRCIFIGTNAAELEWVVSKYHRHSLLAELSWRNKAQGAKAWESSSKLISSGKCRKKNLAAGAEYEFRVRAVEDLPGGLVGLRSDWSDSISIMLMPDKTTDSSSNSNSNMMGGGGIEKQLKRQNSYFGNHKSNLPNVVEEEDSNSNSNDHPNLPNLPTNPSQPISMKAPVKPVIDKAAAAVNNTNMNTIKLRRKSSFVSSTNSSFGLGCGVSYDKQQQEEEEELLNSMDSSSSSCSDAKKKQQQQQFHRFDRFPLPPSSGKATAADKRPDSQSGARSQRAGLETADDSPLHEMTKKVRVVRGGGGGGGESDDSSKVKRRVQPPKLSSAADKFAWNLKGHSNSDGKASNVSDMKGDFEVEEEEEEEIIEEEEDIEVGGQPLREQPLRSFTKQQPQPQPTGGTHTSTGLNAKGAVSAKTSTPLSAARKDRDSSNIARSADRDSSNIARSADRVDSKQQSNSKVDDHHHHNHHHQQQQPISAAAAAATRVHGHDDDVEETEHSNRTDVEEEEDEYLNDESFEEEEEEEERVFVLNVPRMMNTNTNPIYPNKAARGNKRQQQQQQQSTEKSMSDGLSPPPPYMHPVRAEPYTKSSIVGYLVGGGGREVVSNAECGSWIKVRIHVAAASSSSSSSSPRSRKSIGAAAAAAAHPSTDPAAVAAAAWGWSIRADAQHNYLTLQQKAGSSGVRVDPTSTYTLPPIVPHTAKHKVTDDNAAAAVDDRTPPKDDAKKTNSISTPPPLDDPHCSSSSHRPLADLSMHSTPLLSPTPGKPKPTADDADEDEVDTSKEQVQEWSELFDSDGHVYYYNASTFQSQWEPPDWVEECDAATGHK